MVSLVIIHKFQHRITL